MKTDREKLIELLTDSTVYVRSYEPLSKAITEQIIEEKADYLISKGVTIPVRCGECKRWNTQEKNSYSQTCMCERFSLFGYSEIFTKDNDFCSYGERKEE